MTEDEGLEARLHKAIYDADRAREVLDNPVYQDVWTQVEKDLIESWKNTPSTNENRDARERIHLSLTMLHKVKGTIEQTMAGGAQAKEELTYLQKVAAEARRLLGMTS